jgi:hypothetical protein
MITFFSALAGGIELTVEGKASTYWASTAENLASFIREFGISDRCFATSSMDFASEEGFENDNDAHIMLDAAFALKGQ